MSEKQNPWCKVFEVEGNQVLTRLKMNEEEDQMEISLETYINDMFMETGMGGFEKNGSTAEEKFPTINQEYAEKFFTAMKSLIEKTKS